MVQEAQLVDLEKRLPPRVAAWACGRTRTAAKSERAAKTAGDGVARSHRRELLKSGRRLVGPREPHLAAGKSNTPAMLITKIMDNEKSIWVITSHTNT